MNMRPSNSEEAEDELQARRQQPRPPRQQQQIGTLQLQRLRWLRSCSRMI